MKSKVKKYFITYLALVLILSNFSFAVTLAFCKMNGDNTVCACSHIDGAEKSGLSIKRIPGSCCETKIVELSNSNILEILNSYSGNYLFQADVLNTDNFSFSSTSTQASRIYSEFSFHPPNSEIPILNSSLLI
jgi:hypothetical protein